MHRSVQFFCSVSVLLLASSSIHAAVLTFTLGSASPSFTDGQTSIGTATFNAAVAANPAPFNGFIGSDVTGPNFSASWAYAYGSIGAPIGSATLTLGLYDHDSAVAGNQVASFSLGGVDLTSLLNTSLEGHGGANAEYDIYTITLPSTTFASLAAGTPGLALTLQGPGGGVLGNTPFNGAGLDFSTVTITTSVATPEPAAWALALGGVALIGLRRRGR